MGAHGDPGAQHIGVRAGREGRSEGGVGVRPYVTAAVDEHVWVAPGDVTERNAREVVEALRDELDRSESTERPAAPPAEKPEKKK